jgi:multidrug resistance efflux pump
MFYRKGDPDATSRIRDAMLTPGQGGAEIKAFGCNVEAPTDGVVVNRSGRTGTTLNLV